MPDTSTSSANSSTARSASSAPTSPSRLPDLSPERVPGRYAYIAQIGQVLKALHTAQNDASCRSRFGFSIHRSAAPRASA